jgi:opacity protein-like surface antigen
MCYIKTIYEMKKVLLLLAMGLMFAGSVSAQEYYYGPRRVVRHRRPREENTHNDFNRVRIGVTGGLNLANTVSGYDNNVSTGTIAGFNAGLFLDVPLIFPLSFEPEVLYSQKGYSASTPDGHFTSREDFIDVPLLAKFHLAPGFNFLIGPQLSFLTNTTNTYSSGFTITEQNHQNNNNGNNTFLDGVIGVSFDLNQNVDLRARYTIDFNQGDGYGDSYVPEYRNQVFQIGLGIKFD